MRHHKAKCRKRKEAHIWFEAFRVRREIFCVWLLLLVCSLLQTFSPRGEGEKANRMTFLRLSSLPASSTSNRGDPSACPLPLSLGISGNQAKWQCQLRCPGGFEGVVASCPVGAQNAEECWKEAFQADGRPLKEPGRAEKGSLQECLSFSTLCKNTSIPDLQHLGHSSLLHQCPGSLTWSPFLDQLCCTGGMHNRGGWESRKSKASHQKASGLRWHLGQPGHHKVGLLVYLLRPCPLGWGGQSDLEVTKEWARGRDGPWSSPGMPGSMEGKEAGMQDLGAGFHLLHHHRGGSLPPPIVQKQTDAGEVQVPDWGHIKIKK